MGEEGRRGERTIVEGTRGGTKGGEKTGGETRWEKREEEERGE